MSTSKKNAVKVEQYNILLLGLPQKLNFIKNVVPYCKNILEDEPKNIHVDFRSNASVITTNYFKVFDKKFCFIDTPITFNVQSLYEVLIDGVHAILIFTDNYFSAFEWYMNTLFKRSDFPSDNVMFVTMCKKNNTLVTAVNLQKKLKDLNVKFKVSLNENLFLIKVVEQNTLKFPKEFCGSLEHFCSLQPCVHQFSVDIPFLFTITADMFPLLIEVLHFIEAELITLQKGITQNPQRILVISETRFTICIHCYFEDKKRCHNECDCLYKTCEELENCQVFDGDICQQCSCSIEDHVSTRYFLADDESLLKRTKIDLMFERNTIIHFLASLYVFCKLRNGLPDVCKNFKEEYWSLGKRRNVSRKELVYIELENKITELESNCCKPTAEEVTLLIEEFYKQEWCSFLMVQYLQTECQLKFITNAQQAGAASTSKQINNIQRLLKFPEMKTKLVGGSHCENGRDVLFENLRKDLVELKMSTDKERKMMQDQIDELKRQIEQNNTC